jgi:type II secretory pathway component PulF
MTIYNYQIIQDGKKISSQISASSASEVAQILKNKDTTIISIQDSQANHGLKKKAYKISLKDKISFSNYLATMIDAGMSLIPALDVLISDSKDKNLTLVLTDVRNKIEQGKSLSDSLKLFPDIFDEAYTSIIKAGEESGQLSEVLNNLSDKYKSDFELRKQVTGALFYPGIILSVLCVVGIIMMIVVVPKVISVFDKLNVKLPITTRILVGLTKILTFNIYLTGFGFLALVVGGLLLFRSRIGGKIIGVLKVKLPIIKNISRSVDLARLTSTLAILLKAGVPIETAMGISSQVIADPALKKTLSNAMDKIKSGTSISQSLISKEKIIPEIMIKIIDIGEKTGSLEKVLKTLNQSYDDEVRDKLKTMATLIEPLMMIFVGIVVGGFVISIIGPIYQIVGAVGR